MSRPKWVSGRKDGRVIDEQTGKVYSCKEYCGLDLHLNPRELELVCERYALHTQDGRKFSWYTQYMSDHPGSEFPLIPVVKYEPVRKPKKPERVKLSGKLDKHAMVWVNIFYKAMSIALSENGGNKIIVNVYELKDLVDAIIPRFMPLFPTTTTALSRHIVSNQELYARVFKLQLGSEYSRKARRYVYQFLFETVEGAEKIIEERGFDFRQYAISSVDNPRAMPVIRMSDKMVFSSIRKAAKLTGLNYGSIIANCRGDMECVNLTNSTQEFRFVRYVD